MFGLNLPNFITIADLGLPVGLGGVPILQSGISLPAPDAELVTLEAQDATEERHEFISDEIDRRDVTSHDPDLQEVSWNPDYAVSAPSLIGAVAKSEDQIWFERMFPGVPYVPPQQTVGTPTAQIVQAEEEDMGWISDTVGDIYAAVDTSLGGWLPGGVPVGSSIPGQVFANQPTPPPGPGPTMGPPSTAGTMPPPPTGGPMAGACDEDPWKGYVWKKHCGQWRWVKQKRRRRRAIVTQQDLKGLAALKGVLGQGKSFEVWIATHS